MRRKGHDQRKDLEIPPPTDQTQAQPRHTLCWGHRHRILLSGDSYHPRRKTGHLPTGPLRHTRMEEKLQEPARTDREPQQHRQRQERPQRRMVPSIRTRCSQPGTTRAASRSQPAPSHEIPVPAKTTIHRKQRPTTAAADTRGRSTQRPFTQRADNPRATHLAHPGETRTDSNHPRCRLQRARKTKTPSRPPPDGRLLGHNATRNGPNPKNQGKPGKTGLSATKSQGNLR